MVELRPFVTSSVKSWSVPKDEEKSQNWYHNDEEQQANGTDQRTDWCKGHKACKNVSSVSIVTIGNLRSRPAKNVDGEPGRTISEAK